jgi:hypothetical protein
MVLDELEVGAQRIETPPQIESRGERGERRDEGERSNGRLPLEAISAAAREEHEQRAR